MDIHSSVRGIETLADVPVGEGSRLIFMLGSRVLSPDLSLAHQEVSDGDTIRILCKKKTKQIRRNPFTAEINHRQEFIERMNRELYMESVRLSDVSFLPYEGSKQCEKLFAQMYDSSTEDEYTCDPSPTKIPKHPPTKISDEALPICWEEEIHDRSVVPPCFSPSIKRAYTATKKHSVVLYESTR